MVAYLKVGPQVRTYSDYLRAAWEAEKEDFMELPRGQRTQTTDNPPNPWATIFPPAETQGQPSHPKGASCLFGTFRGRGHQE